MTEAETKVEEGTEEKKDTLPPATYAVEDAGAARKKIKIEIPADRIKGKLRRG